MFYHDYINSFKVDYQGKAKRGEFWTVMFIDLLAFLDMGFGLSALQDPEGFDYLYYFTFVKPLFVFLYPYRYVFYVICFLWVIFRHAAIVALMARRLQDAGYNVNWLYVPLYRMYLMAQPSQTSSKK